ncbi:MAG TPA: hypothetical protein VFT85_04715 [Acidimicrobiia bacterium]|nr:hypothetical protein [Acidimicrobiia bacterium]
MATKYQSFEIGSARAVPSVTFPEMAEAGSNIGVFSLKFDATTDEACQFTFDATNYGSGNLTIDIFWFADTASSGDVVWGAAIAAITPNTDTQDIETDSWATENTVTDSHLGTTGQRLHLATITVSNLDSLAARDYVALRIRRLGSNGSDTMSGDAQLVRVTVSYSDT